MSRPGRTRFHLLLLLPALVFYTAFWMIPALAAFVSSFTQWNGISFASIRFIGGLANYAELIGDRWFWNALRNNLAFVAVIAGLDHPARHALCADPQCPAARPFGVRDRLLHPDRAVERRCQGSCSRRC